MTNQGFELDVSNPGWYKAWGVVRSSPWDVAGAFATKADAEQALQKFGPDYRVVYGSRKIGSNDFMFE